MPLRPDPKTLITAPLCVPQCIENRGMSALIWLERRSSITGIGQIVTRTSMRVRSFLRRTIVARSPFPFGPILLLITYFPLTIDTQLDTEVLCS